MDLDIAFSGEEAERCMQNAILIFLSAMDTLKGLFFVKSLFESLKVSQFQLALVQPLTDLPHPFPLSHRATAPPPISPAPCTATISVIMLIEASAAKSGLFSEAAVSCRDIFKLITLKVFRNNPSVVVSVDANKIKTTMAQLF